MSTLRTFNLQHPESSNNNIQLAEGGGVSVTAGILTATNVSSTNVTTTEVTATNGTFSGNLSVGGVLSYEDVTNVDSTGIGTFRDGLHVTSGSVGIGTDNPGEKLHVNQGNILINQNGTSASLIVTTDTNRDANVYFGDSDSQSRGRIRYNNSADYLSFSTAGANERLRIASNGRIGVNNISPNSTLDIVDGTAELRITSTGQYRTSLINSASGFQIQQTGAKNILFETNGTERLRVTSGGDTELRNTVEIVTNTYSQYLKFRTTQTNNQSAVTGAIAAQGKSAWGGDLIFFSKDANSTPNDTVTERMRIQSDGKVGINSITPTARLDINHPHTEQGLVVRSRYGNIATAMVKFDTDPDSNGGDGNVLHIHGGNSRTDSEILHIDSTGVGDIFDIRGDGLTRVYKQLQLEHSSNVAKIIFNEYGANDIKAQIEMDQINGDSGQLIFRTQDSGTLSERFRIASDGKIHVGGNGTGTDQLNIIAAGSGINISRANSGSPSANDSLGALGFKGYATGNSSSAADAKIHAVASHNHSGSSAPADLIFSVKPTTTGPGSSPTERMRILNDGMIETNGVMNFYAAFRLYNNVAYTWDIPVPDEGGYGNSFRCECGYNHYYTTAYGAHRSAWISSRGTSTNNMIDQDQSHSQAGYWTFSKPNTTTFRVTKTAGTYGGQGYGFIHVRFNSF